MSNRMTKLLSKLVPSQTSIQKLRARLENRAVISYLLCIGVSIVAILGASFYGYLYLRLLEWQFLALALFILALGIAAIIGAGMVRRGHPSRGIWVMLLTGQLVVAVSTIFVGGQGIWYAAGVILSTLLISSLTMSSTDSPRAIAVGIVAGIAALFVDEYVNLWQTNTPALLSYFVIAVVVVLLVFYLLNLSIFFANYNLRGKITIAVFSAALLSIIILAAISNQTYRATLVRNANQTLLLAADRTASEVDQYLAKLISDLERINTEASVISNLLKVYISLPTEDRAQATELIFQVKSFQRNLRAIEMVLLDQNGVVILHTTYADVSSFAPYLGLSTTDKSLIDTSIHGGGPYVSSVIFPTLRQMIYIDKPYIYIGTRITDVNGEALGFVMAGYPLDELQRIVQANNGLAGDQSFAVLLDDNYMRIANSSSPANNYTLVYPLDPGTFNRLQQENRIPPQRSELITTNFIEFKTGLDRLYATPFFETQEVETGQEFNVAAGTRLSLKNWVLVFMQPRSIVLLPVTQQSRTNVLITGLVGGLAIVASALLAQLIVGPIVHLTKAAERASAGDLSFKAPVSTGDEVGKLGIAFNSMVDQLGTMFQGLEQRVNERTAELTKTTEQLEYRASRLQMVAEVAHTVSAVTDPEQLLSLVVTTISERFGFYHVGIFIVDKMKDYAVLMASNSEGGKRMLARGHRLRVGEEGLVGYVTDHGEARIALDVGADAVYFNNPDLPETRSEITLPLRVGANIIGALDVQSTMPKAFDASDIALLSTLADQVAMAIENTRLISDAQRTVRELEIAQRQYLQQEWSKVITARPQEGYHYSFGKIAPIMAEEPSIVPDDVPQSPTVIDKPSEGNGNRRISGLVVPILLRGQTIGLIELSDTDTPHHWSENEISLAASVADQVGQALENARLLETTSRRAERERLVSQITTKLRASNDPQEILETAVKQLKEALKVRSVQVRVDTGVDKDGDAHEEA